MKTSLSVIFLFVFFIELYSQNEPEPPAGYCGDFTLKLSYFLGLIDFIEKMPPVPESLREHNDIIYKEIDSTKLKLDIYHLMDLNELRPAIVFIHGGTWKSGDKKDYRKYLVDFALKGYVTVTIQYRLAGVAKFPAAVNDVKCAVKWIKENGNKYFIDTNNIAVVGGSAGGHLAMMIGYSQDAEIFNECSINNVNTKVNAIVNLYGPCDLTTEYGRNHPGVINFLGKKYEDEPEIFRAASPLFFITKDDTPTLIFQGTIDDVVPVSQSDTLKNALDRIGVYAEYHRLEGWPHTMDLEENVNKYCEFYMEKFFKRFIPFSKN